ncbi:MAG: DUF2971 domain-containing protein [Bacteroidetes bacterium]|nr:DUF2971 domain-containing protein [Bacteroidota bacterium]
MNLDRKIYKYCSYDAGELIVSGQLLKFSNTSSFNDPFDCDINLLEFDFDDCGQEVIDDMEKIKQDISKSWRADMSKTIDSIPKAKLEESYRNSQINKIQRSSICCFSRIYNSTTMWSHYADNHKGICLIFDPFVKDPFKDYNSDRFTEGSVDYDNYTPVNYLKSKLDGIRKLFLTKSIDWKPEEEVRYIIFEDYGFFSFKKEFLTGVIFGLEVEKKDIDRFINICDKKGYTGLIFGRFIKEKLQLCLEKY